MTDNVVPFIKPAKASNSEAAAPIDEFTEIERLNKEKKAKLERERLDSNKKVLRDYRIKNK